MIRKYLLPFLALVGVALGILAAIQSARTLTPTPMVSEAPAPPYETFVAGAGMVEAMVDAMDEEKSPIVPPILPGLKLPEYQTGA